MYVFIYTAPITNLSEAPVFLRQISVVMQSKHHVVIIADDLVSVFPFFQERLKRCVQMESSQKLDNSRTHRNNLVNALSSSSSSSPVSVGVEATGPEERLFGSAGSYHMPPTSSELTVEGADDEELKAKEKFQNNSGDNELHKDYKKQVL